MNVRDDEDEDLSYIEAREVTDKSFGKMVILAAAVWLIDWLERAIARVSEFNKK